jgi:hypothetical protein
MSFLHNFTHIFNNEQNFVFSMIDYCGIIMCIITLYYIFIKPTQKSEQTNNTEKQIPKDEFILIGITGRKKSGKDTIGHYLIDNHGFVRVAYADSLKKACKHIFGFTDEQLYDDELKEVVDEYWNHSPREILQKVGTELFRNELSRLCEHISNDIWIRSVDRKIKKLRAMGYTRIVITDVRFQNELDYIEKMKGYSWKVSRPSLLANVDPTLPVHASEALIDDFICDTCYINEGTIDQLYDSTENVIHDILVKPNTKRTVTSSND